jgi:hypothetical protein
LIRPGLEHTIYGTKGKHTNHLTTDAFETVYAFLK